MFYINNIFLKNNVALVILFVIVGLIVLISIMVFISIKHYIDRKYDLFVYCCELAADNPQKYNKKHKELSKAIKSCNVKSINKNKWIKKILGIIKHYWGSK